jgi:hypothetical protein
LNGDEREGVRKVFSKSQRRGGTMLAPPGVGLLNLCRSERRTKTGRVTSGG